MIRKKQPSSQTRLADVEKNGYRLIGEREHKAHLKENGEDPEKIKEIWDRIAKGRK